MKDDDDRAAKIRKYWSDRGFDVRVFSAEHAVRSDLVNALPRTVTPAVRLDDAIPVKKQRTPA